MQQLPANSGFECLMLRRLRKASLALQGGKEVIIRDESGKIVYVHRDRGF